MKNIRVIGAVALICSLMAVTVAAAQTATSRIVGAANAFLATLDAKQRQSVLFAFDDQKQRARWSNFPTSFVPRAGVSLRELNPAQRSAALALVASALSPMGFEKVQHIMEADEVNKINERGNPMFGGDLYYLSFLGAPSEKEPWLLQFGGHHLALNITIAAERGVLTPTLTGAQPATFRLNGKTIRRRDGTRCIGNVIPGCATTQPRICCGTRWPRSVLIRRPVLGRPPPLLVFRRRRLGGR